MNYLPIEDCERGHIYRLKSRNLAYGVYDGDEGFIGIREKFGDLFLFTEYHWDTEKNKPFGTVQPLEEIGVLPETIEPSIRGVRGYCASCKQADVCFYVSYSESIQGARYWSELDKKYFHHEFPGQWVCLNCIKPRPAFVQNQDLFNYLDNEVIKEKKVEDSL